MGLENGGTNCIVWKTIDKGKKNGASPGKRTTHRRCRLQPRKGCSKFEKGNLSRLQREEKRKGPP